MSIISGLMLFFSAVTLGAVGWVVARVVPGSLVRRRARMVTLHREALVALSDALSRQQPPEHRARLIANFDAHRGALLALEPTAAIPGPAAAPDRRLAA